MNTRVIDRWCGLALIVCALVCPAVAQTTDSEVQRLAAENKQLRTQVAELTAELESLRQELAELRQDNTQLANETEVLEQQAIELQALAGVATDDRALAAQSERIKRNYDEETDRTVVTFGPEKLDVEGSAGDFYFSIVYSHAGRDTAAVPTATLFLQAYRSGRLFDRRDAADFELNGEPMSLAITGFDLTPRKTGLPGRTRIDRSDEIVEFTVDHETLSELGDARSLVVREGRVVLTFDQDDLAAMRAVAMRMRAE